jgi:murein L,D-transpeptidase YafK
MGVLAMMPNNFFRNAVACGTVMLGAACGSSAHLRSDKMNLSGFSTGIVAPSAARTNLRNTRARDARVLSTAFVTSSFAREQLRNTRVRNARDATQARIEQLFADKNLTYPAAEVYLRVFKSERELELWVRSSDSDRFTLLKTYGICRLAGEPGPKRRRGDRQVPEGLYHVDLFNPASSYHLSMRINYPNAYDRAVNGTRGNLGGDIYIHGGCVSEGCLAMTDEGIRELYWIAVQARAVGQQRIPVHIFPGRFDGANMRIIERAHKRERDILAFWNTLKPNYEYFEKERRLPDAVVRKTQYQIGD